jgi:hypothetical protein
VVVIKVLHTNPTDAVDADISTGWEVLADKALYSEYLQQLGLVSALENEQHYIRQSRGPVLAFSFGALSAQTGILKVLQ